MAKPLMAGRLTQSVAFDKRWLENPDHPHDEGNTVSDWTEMSRAPAEFVYLRGGERVMSGRLQGSQTLIMRLRATSKTRAIAVGWSVRDLKTGTRYNIRDITPDPNSNASIDLLCESGVAS